MAIMKGASTFWVDLPMGTEMMAADRPRMTSTFRMLEPTMLPTVMSALPADAAVMETAASGALVPMATMVRPMMS